MVLAPNIQIRPAKGEYMVKVLYTAHSVLHVLRYHVPFLRYLHQQGHEVHLVVGEGACPASLEFVGSYLIDDALANYAGRNGAQPLATLMANQRFDAVVSCSGSAAQTTCMAIKLSGYKPKLNTVISTGFNFDMQTSPLKRRYRMRLLRKFRKITDLMIATNSQDLMLARKYKLAANVEQLSGSITNMQGLQPPTLEERTQARSKFGVSDDQFMVVYTGRFDKNHHQKQIIYNMLFLPRNVRLFLLGDGPMKQDCIKTMNDYKLADVVRMPGSVEDVMPYIRACDLTLSAARYEGLPQFVLEGQAMGIPAVVSAVKGNLDLVTNGYNGLTYTVNKQDSFIHAMQAMILKDDLRQKLSANARSTALERDSQSSLAAVAEICERALR